MSPDSVETKQPFWCDKLLTEIFVLHQCGVKTKQSNIIMIFRGDFLIGVLDVKNINKKQTPKKDTIAVYV